MKRKCNCNYPELVGMSCPVHGEKSKQPIEELDLSEYIGYVPSHINLKSFEDVGYMAERIQRKINEIINHLSRRENRENK